MKTLFYKGLSRDPQIGNTLVWVLPNIWRLGPLRDTKFETNFSNEMLLNVAKYQGYDFTVSELLRENQQKVRTLTPFPPVSRTDSAFLKILWFKMIYGSAITMLSSVFSNFDGLLRDVFSISILFNLCLTQALFRFC